MQPYQRTIVLAAFLAGASILMAAAGSHWVAQRVDAHLTDVFNTAIHYQQMHALALFAVGLAQAHWPHQTLWRWAGRCIVIGLLMFCAGLYTLVATGQPLLGVITPIGAMMMVLGWLLIAISAYQSTTTP